MMSVIDNSALKILLCLNMISQYNHGHESDNFIIQKVTKNVHVYSLL